MVFCTVFPGWRQMIQHVLRLMCDGQMCIFISFIFAFLFFFLLSYFCRVLDYLVLFVIFSPFSLLFAVYTYF